MNAKTNFKFGFVVTSHLSWKNEIFELNFGQYSYDNKF